MENVCLYVPVRMRQKFYGNGSWRINPQSNNPEFLKTSYLLLLDSQNVGSLNVNYKQFLKFSKMKPFFFSA